MYSTAFNAEHNSEIDGGPFGIHVATVRTPLVARDIQEVQTQRIAEGKEGGREGGKEGGRERGRERRRQ